MDYVKHDMAFTYEGRTFAVRAYQDSTAGHSSWHATILENRTPLHHELSPAASSATCFADAVRFLTEQVDARSPLCAPLAQKG